MNLYQKLVEIQKSVRSLAKDSYANSYQYVSGSKVLDAVRERMDQLGVLLVQQIDSIENTRIDYQVKNGSKSEMLSKVMMTFTWVDAESGDKLPVPFGANGMNNWDKGLGSALTYAERYFLLKFFHIATDEDDVDALPPRGNEDALPKRAKGMDTPPPVSLSAPKPDKDMMHQGHAKWQAMLDSILAGKTTLEKVKERYFFPEADEIVAKEWLLTHQL
jgi:hypothetical protein